MTEITLEQFGAEPERFVLSALSVGDIFAIDTGKGGKAVLMEEAEYNIMREAVVALFALETHK